MPLKKHFVLVVEDNEINQKVAKLLLGELNCQVDIAENGHTALTSLQKNRYDLVFMDIGLPDMSGIEVTSQLRQRENVAHRVPVIALTADCLSGDEETWAKVGIDDYLIKPYTLEQLEEMIEKWAKKEGKR
jgi:CheY-like chemotaxis protein